MREHAVVTLSATHAWSTEASRYLASVSERSGFRYWREPLCLVAIVLYVANTVWWKPMTDDSTSFVHCYLGDVLCLPVCVPMTLWLQRRVGLRGDDRRPTARELLLHWLLWSACFEWLGPRMPLLAPGAVSDPWDAVAYAVGGLLAAVVWRPRRGEHLLGRPSSGGVLSGGMLSVPAIAGRAAVAMAVALFVLSAYRVGVMFR